MRVQVRQVALVVLAVLAALVAAMCARRGRAVKRRRSDELTVLAVVPSMASPGDTVVVWGSGFSADPEDNVVRFGGTAARVVAATPFSLMVEVPPGAASGPVAVSRSGALATGAPDTEIVES